MKKSLLTVIAVLTLILKPAVAQRFDWATSGGYVGISNSFNGAIDIALDPQGNIYTMDYGNGAQQCQGDTIAPLSSYTTFIYKFDPQGTLQFIRRIGALSGDFYGYNLETDEAGNLYVLGQPNGVVSIIINDDTVAAVGNTNQLIKLDSDGNFVWKINTGAATNGQGCMLQYSQGHVYYQSGNLTVSRIDTAGQVGPGLTASYYSSPTSSTGPMFKGSGVFSNGDLLFAATSFGRIAYGTATLNNSGNPALTIPVLLVRCDTNMNVIWARYASNVRNPDNNNIPVAIDHNDAVYVGVQVNYEIIIGTDTIGAQGTIFTGEGGIIKIDAAGNDVWARALQSTTTCYAWCISNTSDNSGILLGGGYTGVPTLGAFTLPSSPFGLPYIAKIDETGNFTALFGYLQAPGGSDALCLQADDNGRYYVGGKLSNTSTPVFSCTPIASNKGFYLGAFTEQPDSVPTPVIQVNGAVLTATPPFSGDIQWYLNGVAIAGETGQTLTATQDGDYSVTYSYTTGCIGTDTSVVVLVTVSAIDETAASYLNVYPNPADGSVIIGNLPADSDLNITDPAGKLIYTKRCDSHEALIRTREFTNGLYIIQVSNKRGAVRHKLLINH